MIETTFYYQVNKNKYLYSLTLQGEYDLLLDAHVLVEYAAKDYYKNHILSMMVSWPVIITINDYYGYEFKRFEVDLEIIPKFKHKEIKKRK